MKGVFPSNVPRCTTVICEDCNKSVSKVECTLRYFDRSSLVWKGVCKPCSIIREEKRSIAALSDGKIDTAISMMVNFVEISREEAKSLSPLEQFLILNPYTMYFHLHCGGKDSIANSKFCSPKLRFFRLLFTEE